MPCQNSTAADLVECDSRFRRLADSSIIGIFEGDDSGRILKANDAFLSMLGYSRGELELGLVRWDRLTVPGYEHVNQVFHEELQALGRAAPAELEYVRKDGSRIPILVGLAAAGTPLGSQAFGFMVDLTRRRQAEDAMRASEEKFRQLAENIHEVFWMMDTGASQILYVSPAYEEIWGQKCDALYSDPENRTKSIHPDDLSQALRIFARQLEGEIIENEYRIVQPGGDVRWIRDRAFPVCDKEGVIVRLAGVAEDITNRKLADSRLIYQSLHDDLTGLPNRRHFREKLTRAIEECEAGKSGAVFFIDLDQFKLVNDTLGHAAGDRILKEVVERLLKVCGKSNTLARFGGDEFTLLARGIEEQEQARILGEALIGCLDAPFRIEGRELYIGASVGVSLFPANGAEPYALKRAANIAMHEAKRAGKNQLKFFTSEFAAAAEARLELETRLRSAVSRSEFRLQFQPQFATCASNPTRFEALIRWCPEDGPMASPGSFIPALEQNGLIVPVGTWVLREACERCVEWQKGSLAEVGVAVNVSPTQFAQPDFFDTVKRILAETGLRPNLLELELTETVFVIDVETSVRTLTELRTLGVTIALDDFGTGYSSLSYLQRLPLDALKIDQSFVAEAEGDPQRVAVLRCVIDLAHAHGLRVIGEGVETVGQLKLLQSLHCDELQGYYPGRPAFEVYGENRIGTCPRTDVSECLEHLSEHLATKMTPCALTAADAA